MIALSNSMNQDFNAELRNNRPAVESDDQLTERYDRERYEWNLRTYDRFGTEHELTSYAARIRGGDSHWFDAGAKHFFSSRIGACLHGRSPANWNLFITSERYSSNTQRRYSIRQLLITGKIITIGGHEDGFMRYASSAAAQRAALAYIRTQEAPPDLTPAPITLSKPSFEDELRINAGVYGLNADQTVVLLSYQRNGMNTLAETYVLAEQRRTGDYSSFARAASLAHFMSAGGSL